MNEEERAQRAPQREPQADPVAYLRGNLGLPDLVGIRKYPNTPGGKFYLAMKSGKAICLGDANGVLSARAASVAILNATGALMPFRHSYDWHLIAAAIVQAAEEGAR
jgi:hypothetical protein